MLVVQEHTQKKDAGLICNPIDKKAESALHRSATERELSDLIALKYARAEKDHLRSRLFFFVGLSISLALTILAFEWRVYDRGELVDLGSVEADFNEIIEIPPTEQPPPPPPKKIMSPVIKEVDDEVLIEEIEVELDVEATEDMIIEEVTNFEFVGNEVVEEKAEVIYDIVESRPEPVGGMQAFYQYVKDNMEYPSSARRMNVSGRVFVQFVVEKDGSITDIVVLKGFHPDCDEEAVRVLQNAPKWNPGKQRGTAVRVYQRLPIMFVLRE